MSTVDEVARAVADGGLVVIPIDTVYGLACRPDSEESVRALSAVKKRSPAQPIALVAWSTEELVELIPELDVRGVVRGPFTVVVPNPKGRLPWLGGGQTIGVRIPEVSGVAGELLERVGVVAATSANLHGGPDPRRLSDVPVEILDRVAAAMDGGELPGTPSTVVDLTGPEPRILREGAVSVSETLGRVAGALSQ